jgi:hypothetical protein
VAAYCYLFDASALVALVVKNPDPDARVAKQKVLTLIAREQELKRKKGKPEFYVPNICMAECSSALAKLILTDADKKKEDAYREHMVWLLDWVSSSGKHIIKTYKLKRHHLVDIEKIFIADRKLPLRKGRHLSGHDGIIIAMAQRMEKKCGSRKSVILTTDQRIVDVCAHYGTELPMAVDLVRQPIPGL